MGSISVSTAKKVTSLSNRRSGKPYGVVERSEDPPQNSRDWWVFAALDHTLSLRGAQS
jgi:hypothetical protein